MADRARPVEISEIYWIVKKEITSINPNTNLNWAKLKDIESIPDQHYDNESIAG